MFVFISDVTINKTMHSSCQFRQSVMFLWLLAVPYPSACQVYHSIRGSHSVICTYDSVVKVSYALQLYGELRRKKYLFSIMGL